MKSSPTGLRSLFAAALLLAAEPSLAQKSLGIAATQLGSDFRQESGKRLTFICPASDGAKAVVYGTDVYADFSTICAAAIHAGVLKSGQAGDVTIVTASGAKSFKGSQRNGVTSKDYGPWDYAFSFSSDGEPGEIAWSTAWSLIPAGFADSVVITCPAGGGTSALVWGTNAYTADSTICVAAVHAGVITAKEGGTIAVMRVSGLKQYLGTERHGIESRSWGAHSDAFGVKAASPPVAIPPPASVAITTSALPDGVAAAYFTTKITATAGSGSGYGWQVIDGGLPAGLTMTPTGTPAATLYGTPTAPGIFNFTVMVTDDAGASDGQIFRMTIETPGSAGSGGSGPAARTITLAGFTAEGTAPVTGPRTITLAGFTAEGIAPVTGPRTITVVGWTAAGP